MSPEELYGYVSRRPFAPFRIHLGEHVTYDIHNPDHIRVGKSMAVLGLTKHPESEFFDLLVWFELRHVTRVEPITTPN